MDTQSKEYNKTINSLQFSGLVKDRYIKKYLHSKSESILKLKGMLRIAIAEYRFEKEIYSYQEIAELSVKIFKVYDSMLLLCKKIRKTDALNHFKISLASLKEKINSAVLSNYSNSQFLKNYLAKFILIEIKDSNQLLEQYICVENELAQLKIEINDESLRIKETDYKRLKHTVENHWNILNIDQLEQISEKNKILSEEFHSIKEFEKKQIIESEQERLICLEEIENLIEKNQQSLPAWISNKLNNINGELVSLRAVIINCKMSKHILIKTKFELYQLKSEISRLILKGDRIKRTSNNFDNIVSELRDITDNHQTQYTEIIKSFDEEILNQKAQHLKNQRNKVLTNLSTMKN